MNSLYRPNEVLALILFVTVGVACSLTLVIFSARFYSTRFVDASDLGETTLELELGALITSGGMLLDLNRSKQAFL